MGDAAIREAFALRSTFGYQAEVAPGIHWARLQLPFKPEDHINVWLLRGEDGYRLVDTGLDDPATRALWDEILAALPGKATIREVFVTHHHPDHCGLAAWFESAHGARIFMAERECALAAGMLAEDDDGENDALSRHGMITGAGHRALRHTFYRSHVRALPRHPIPLTDGSSTCWGTERWRTHLVGGHTPAHAVFHCPDRNVLITGDHILPDIVTNIGALAAEEGTTPVADYLASLERCDTLPDDVLVLPAHGLPFIGLQARCRQLREIHHERLAGACRACAEPSTVAELLPRLYGRELTGLGALLGFNQTKAYLDYLAMQGRVASACDSDGRVLFRQTEPG
jgi:glyoxylase-like metal-dependent hydrolase (beta-lactamase superfamily II)